MHIWSQLLIHEWKDVYTLNHKQATLFKEIRLNKNFNIFIRELHKKRKDFDDISRWYYDYANAAIEEKKKEYIDESIVEGIDDLLIKDFFVRYSRYEGFKFFNILVEVKDEKYLKVMEVIYKSINKVEPATLIIKDKRFNGNDEVLKYPQFIKIYDKKEKSVDKTYNKKVIRKEPSVVKYYKSLYGDKENGIYYRALEIIYLVEDLNYINDENLKMVVHSENLLFRRSKKYNEKVIKITDNLDFLQSSLKFLNQVWPRIRTYFFIAPKFTLNYGKNSTKNKLFLNILETVAQLEIMINQMDYDVKNIKTSYENKFERVRFNLEKNNLTKELEFFDEILEKVKNYPITLTENINNNSNFLEKLYSQVTHLREDTDSYGNIIMQWLMSMLSVILILWGGFEIFIDKGIKEVIYNLPLIVLPLSVALLLVSYTTISRGFIKNFKYYTFEKINENIIKWLKTDTKAHDLDDIKNKYFQYIRNNKTSDIKDILYMVEFYNYLVLALQLKKIDHEEASNHLKELLDLYKKSE